jgi:hypothetical protein
MMTIGSAMGAIYATTKTMFTVVRTFALPSLAPVEHAVIHPLIMLGPLFLVIGSTLPSWGPWARLERPLRWLGYRRTHRALFPLWRVLHQALEPATLEPVSTSNWRDWLAIRDVQPRLYLRYVAIRDALLLLRPYRDDASSRLAHGLSTIAGLHGAQLDATVEAASILIAVDEKQLMDARHEAPPPQARLIPAPTPESTEVGDLRQEVLHLRLVAAALESPIVNAAREQTSSQRMLSSRSVSA